VSRCHPRAPTYPAQLDELIVRILIQPYSWLCRASGACGRTREGRCSSVPPHSTHPANVLVDKRWTIRKAETKKASKCWPFIVLVRKGGFGGSIPGQSHDVPHRPVLFGIPRLRALARPIWSHLQLTSSSRRWGTVAREFTADEATRITGATMAQVEHLYRTGIVIPARKALRRGVSRGYSIGNLMEMATAIAMTGTGANALDTNAAILLMREPEQWQQLCDPATRDLVAVLVLWRPLDRLGTGKPMPVLPQIGPLDTLNLIATGYAVHAAVPLKWMAERLEAATGERLQ
jgi:hypothetical protein